MKKNTSEVFVKEIHLNKTAVTIQWFYREKNYVSMLFRHSDYSWHWDADTRRSSRYVLEQLQIAVFQAIAGKRL